ncbi:hypothetical protein [Lacinutrix jangbogonensis]|uniref:hypothetical protein n=1 Tax=Lacinutrix jangbogonensis TaxID=1469557 RepID=UPI00053D000B|nr:hypothetical protein [Lacinutrix jangbogonensis]
MSKSEKYLGVSIHYSKALNGLDGIIKMWDFKPVKGIGFIKKYTGHYAHIELEIHNSKEEFKRNKIVYNISENQLPLIFRNEIEKTLQFFISYLNAIKENMSEIIFVISDATYHPVDSRPIDYQGATMYAIADCFGKNFHNLSNSDKEVIKNCRIYSLNEKSE